MFENEDTEFHVGQVEWVVPVGLSAGDVGRGCATGIGSLGPDTPPGTVDCGVCGALGGPAQPKRAGPVRGASAEPCGHCHKGRRQGNRRRGGGRAWEAHLRSQGGEASGEEQKELNAMERFL